MKRKGKAMSLNYRKTITALGIALVGVCVPVVMAETDAGRINANESMSAVNRDPFWPVGHTPKYAKRAVTEKAPVQAPKVSGSIDWEEAMNQVVINGVSSRAGDEYIAVINSEMKSVGESVSIVFEGIRYSWTVESITPPGSVKLRRHTAEQENI